MVVTRQLQDAMEVINTQYKGRGTWLFKLSRGDKEPQLVSESASLKFLDVNKDSRDKTPELHMLVEPSGADELQVPVDGNMRYTTYTASRAVTFFYKEDSSSYVTMWLLKFLSTTKVYSTFFEALKNAYQKNQDDGDEHDAWIAPSNEEGGAVAMEVCDEPDQPSLEELEAMHEKEEEAYTQAHSNFSAMVMGAKNTYLQRGGIFDVMDNRTGGIASSGKTLGFKLPDKTSLISRQAILSNAETSMLMLSDSTTCAGAASSKIYLGNLEREQVVRTLNFNKDGTEVPQAQISALSKCVEDSPCLLGLDRNRVAKWDLRTAEGIVQWTGGKDYAQRTNFTCMATSGDGHVVIGSADGKIRMYNSNTLTQAKNTIPGLGKPITAVDVTFDSRWILATTDDYLLVIKTEYEDEGGHRQNAFVSKGAQGRFAMRLLRLKPADEMSEGLAGCSFKGAKFTWVTESNEYERWIAASRGKYTIMWNLRRVKTSTADAFTNGGVPTFEEYHLSDRRQQTVVDSAFMHHRYAPAVAADALVVATTDKVYTLA